MSTPHRTIDVRPQQKLPLSKILALCVNGVRHRILRSALTLAVVALAVAFFMFLQTETRLLQTVGRSSTIELEELRFATRRMNLLTQNRRSLDQAKVLSNQHKDAANTDWQELQNITGWAQPDIKSLAQNANLEAKYLRFFEDLPLGQRVILVGKRKGRETLSFLTTSEVWRDFKDQLKPMHNVKVPGGNEGLKGFLDGYPAYLQQLKVYNQAWNRTVSKLRTDLEAMAPDQDIAAMIANADQDQLRQIQTKIEEKGFVLKLESLAQMQEQEKTQEVLKNVSATLSRSDMKETWKKTFLERNTPGLEEKLSRLKDRKVQELLQDEYTSIQLDQAHAYYTRSRELETNLQSLAGRIDLTVESGIAGRQMFLLLISLVVCMVGITNAMLMSISERFREIATMKCLGATDPFILRQFMLEAAIQGAAGGLIGMIMGLLIALFKTMASFGMDTFIAFPLAGILLSALISFACGVVLSILASIYPSWAASRMAPMEAMRIE